jgi:uncharacterized Zn-finger protein
MNEVEEEKDIPQPLPLVKGSIKCSMCTKVVSNKSNLSRHIKLMHSVNTKKYIKHIKKDGRFECKVCGKTYSHTANLKLHYTHHHTKQEIKQN